MLAAARCEVNSAPLLRNRALQATAIAWEDAWRTQRGCGPDHDLPHDDESLRSSALRDARARCRARADLSTRRFHSLQNGAERYSAAFSFFFLACFFGVASTGKFFWR